MHSSNGKGIKSCKIPGQGDYSANKQATYLREEGRLAK